MREIVFTKPMLRRLMAAYEEANEGGIEPFIFEGSQFVLGFAYYLCEHLCHEFGVSFDLEIPRTSKML